jgi:hypothetical protein
MKQARTFQSWPVVIWWSCRESNPPFYQAIWFLSCRFVASRFGSVRLVTCGFVLGSGRRQERSPTIYMLSHLLAVARSRQAAVGIGLV